MARPRLDPDRVQTASERNARRREREAQELERLLSALRHVADAPTLEEARLVAWAVLQQFGEPPER